MLAKTLDFTNQTKNKTNLSAFLHIHGQKIVFHLLGINMSMKYTFKDKFNCLSIIIIIIIRVNNHFRP